MARLGGARWWVGMWAGLMIAGCGGKPVSGSDSQTPSAGDSSPAPDDRVAQPPPSSQDPTPSPTPPDSSTPTDTISLAPSRWRVSLGQSTVSVATDPNGNVYALSVDPSLKQADAEDPPLVLTKTDASGKQLWRQSWSTPGAPVQLNAHSLAVSPEGNIFMTYTVGCGTNQSCHLARYTLSTGEAVTAWSAVLVKVSPDGKTTWVRSAYANGERALGVAVNSTGTTLLLTQSTSGNSILYWFKWDGTQLGSAWPGNVTAVAFDPQDNIILGSYGPVISKYTPDFITVWIRGFEGPMSSNRGWVTDVGVSAKGTVVASGYFRGDYNWGSSVMTGSGPNGEGTFLIVAEADGTPRWGLTPSSDYTNGELTMAVDPTGQVMLASALLNEGNRVTLDRYNLAGEHLWRHQLGNTKDCGGGWPITRVTSIAIASNHDAILGGAHTGPANIGSGCVSGNVGFVLDVKP